VSGPDLETWATILGTWVLVVGTLGFAYWQLRQTQRLHSATTLLELRERFYSPRLREARRELSLWLLRKDRGEEIENWEVGMFFELMGHLTRTRVLDQQMVWNAFGTWISSYYFFVTRPENLIERWRKESGDPLIFSEFEWLAHRMEIVERRVLPRSHRTGWSERDARFILENEAHLDAQSAASYTNLPLAE